MTAAVAQDLVIEQGRQYLQERHAVIDTVGCMWTCHHDVWCKQSGLCVYRFVTPTSSANIVPILRFIAKSISFPEKSKMDDWHLAKIAHRISEEQLWTTVDSTLCRPRAFLDGVLFFGRTFYPYPAPPWHQVYTRFLSEYLPTNMSNDVVGLVAQYVYSSQFGYLCRLYDACQTPYKPADPPTITWRDRLCRGFLNVFRVSLRK